jgi:hypothetical protein
MSEFLERFSSSCLTTFLRMARALTAFPRRPWPKNQPGRQVADESTDDDDDFGTPLADLVRQPAFAMANIRRPS